MSDELTCWERGYVHYARAPREADVMSYVIRYLFSALLCQAPIYRAYLCNYIYYVYLITQIWILYMNIFSTIGRAHINWLHITFDILHSQGVYYSKNLLLRKVAEVRGSSYHLQWWRKSLILINNINWNVPTTYSSSPTVRLLSAVHTGLMALVHSILWATVAVLLQTRVTRWSLGVEPTLLLQCM